MFTLKRKSRGGMFTQSCLNSIALQAPLSMGFSRQGYWSGLPRPPPGDLPNPGTEPRSFRFAGNSFLSEPPEKRKTTGVGSLSSLQGNCPNQESNQAFLHCRWILYQLILYLGSPKIFIWLCWVLVVVCGI